jgi:hypothetical protein
VFANPSDFGVLDTDDEGVVNIGGDGLSAPVGAAQIESLLFIGGGYIYSGSRKTTSFACAGGNTHVTNGSAVVTDATGGFTANVDAGMLMQVTGSDRVYVVASVDSDTQITLRDAYEGSTSTTVNPTFYPLYAITGSDPYEDASLYAVCANRLCSASANTLKFSGVPSSTTGAPNPHSFAATDYYRFPDGVHITGLATIGQALLVFTTAGVWTYEGLAFEETDAEGNVQHRVQLLSRDIVLVNQAGLATFQQAVIAPCLDGIYLIDGVSSPRKVSRPLDKLYQRYVQRGYSIGGAAVYRGHYFAPILDGSTQRDLLVARLDRPVEMDGLIAFPWTRFNGAGGNISGFAVRTLDAVSEPELLGAESQETSRVVAATAYFSPDATVKQDADGTDFTWMLVTRDFETGNLTENMVRKIRTRAELLDADADAPKIEFDWGEGVRDLDTSTHLWDEENWDDLDADDADGDLVWEDDDDEVYNALNCPMAESEGLDVHKCRVNAKSRFIRFRLRNLEPCAVLRLRSFEVSIRPSKAVRR